MSKAVLAGRLQHISPSQITNFTSCARNWFLDKVLNAPQPKKEHFATGERLHAQVENWYLKGIRPENISAQMLVDLKEVPRPGPNLRVEEPRDYKLGITAANIPVKGRIDLYDPHPDHVRIIDWKSSSDFKYTKTQDELARNTQLMVYARYFFTTASLEYVTVAHGYMLTKGGSNAKFVETDPLDRAHVDGIYEGIESRVEQIKSTAGLADWRDVPANLDHCEAFGGCPYQNICGTGKFAGAGEVIVTKEEHSEFVEKLKVQKRTGVNPPDAALPSKEPVIDKVIKQAMMKVTYTSLAGTESYILVPGSVEEVQEKVLQILGKVVIGEISPCDM